MSEFPIDINRHENMQHGTEEFPCMQYEDHYLNNAYPWHWHDEIEVITVRCGRLLIGISGQQYELKRGDCVFLNACTLHSFEGIRDTECLLPNILFQPVLVCGTENSIFRTKYIRPLLEHSGTSYLIFRADTKEGQLIHKKIIECCRLMKEEEWGYEFEVRNYLSQIMLAVGMAASHIYTEENKTETKRLHRTRKMIDYIQNYYAAELTLEQIAAAAAVSARECMRCFQETIGISPKKYVISVRIQKACQMLRETELSILDICEKCGFQDQSYFTKLFKREIGCAPGQYRKRKE